MYIQMHKLLIVQYESSFCFLVNINFLIAKLNDFNVYYFLFDYFCLRLL